MGVIGRPRNNGKTTYYATFMANGKLVQERSGTDKRGAEKLERRRKREVKAGTYSAEHRSGAVNFETYADSWAEKRTNRTAADDRQRLRDHIVPFFCGMRLQDISLRDTRRFAEELKGKFRSSSTRKNVWGVLTTLFRDAELNELVSSNPCKLPRGFFGRKTTTQKASTYPAADVLLLTTNERIDEDRRVWNALAFYTGMREGEVCGRRFGDWDPTTQPLGTLHVATQYQDQPLKTDDSEGEHVRTVPVHPELERILTDWRERGFELYVGRKPTAEDWIVPQRFNKTKPHTRSGAAKAFHRGRELVGVEKRRLHDTRHTFVSAVRSAGANKDVVEVITHNAKGSVIDIYTEFEWPTLCEAVMLLDYYGQTQPEPSTNLASSPDPHDAQHDAPPKNIVFRGRFSGGAGNRKRRPTDRTLRRVPALSLGGLAA